MVVNLECVLSGRAGGDLQLVLEGLEEAASVAIDLGVDPGSLGPVLAQILPAAWTA